jgi:U3 small nucleolar RNA-associated protein 3
MGLDLPSSDSDADDVSDEEEDEEGTSALTKSAARRRLSTEHDPVQQSKTSRYDRSKLAVEESEEDEGDDDEEEEDAWNPASYHVSRSGKGEAAEADSDDEEAIAMDLAEARRIQKAARDVLGEEDFALPESGPAAEEGLTDLQDVLRLLYVAFSLSQHSGFILLRANLALCFLSR